MLRQCFHQLKNGLQDLNAPKRVLKQVSLWKHQYEVCNDQVRGSSRTEVHWQTLQTDLHKEKVGQDMTEITYHGLRPPALTTIM